jgi:hypothetical protein
MSVVPLASLLGRPSLGLRVEEIPEPALPEPPPAEERVDADLSGAHLLEAGALAELQKLAEQSGYLAVSIPAVCAEDRGKLALVLEEAIESALERRGACPPGIGATSDLDGSLGDQLYRARLIERSGICVTVGSLAAIATLGGSLDAEDSAVMRWWIAAANSRPVCLGLLADNRTLGVYGPPVALETLISPVAVPVRDTVPAPPSDEPALIGDLANAVVDRLVDAESEPHPTLPENEPVHAEPAPAEAVDDDTMDAERQGDATHDDSTHEEMDRAEPEPAMPPIVEATTAMKAARDDTSEERPEPTPVSGEVLRAPLEPTAGDDWPRWVSELRTAQGPKPLAAIERMFVKSYVPLADALARGLAPSEEVFPVLDGWATSFSTSYESAFDALRLRGKRPTMVLDVPDVAHRIGRLHGARAVQLLLVDGLRFDLGLRVESHLRDELRHEVALTERLVLWSGLPTDTGPQLELLGRGPAGLADFSGPPESEVPVARGRMARTARRIKAGHRELLKLDLVEATLAEPGPAEAARLDALALELKTCIASVMETLPPRTLLFVFGDHGFVLSPQGGGTSAMKQGGSRPEEVLVPGFAWLVGGVQ